MQSRSSIEISNSEMIDPPKNAIIPGNNRSDDLIALRNPEQLGLHRSLGGATPLRGKLPSQ
jgi:hypothetical protein